MLISLQGRLSQNGGQLAMGNGEVQGKYSLWSCRVLTTY